MTEQHPQQHEGQSPLEKTFQQFVDTYTQKKHEIDEAIEYAETTGNSQEVAQLLAQREALRDEFEKLRASYQAILEGKSSLEEIPIETQEDVKDKEEAEEGFDAKAEEIATRGVMDIKDIARKAMDEVKEEETKEEGDHQTKGETQQEEKKEAKEEELSALTRQKDHYQERRVGYIKQILREYADASLIKTRKTRKNIFAKTYRLLTAKETNEDIKKQYERAAQLLEKDTKELTEEEKKFLISLDISRFINERKIQLQDVKNALREGEIKPEDFGIRKKDKALEQARKAFGAKIHSEEVLKKRVAELLKEKPLEALSDDEKKLIAYLKLPITNGENYAHYVLKKEHIRFMENRLMGIERKIYQEKTKDAWAGKKIWEGLKTGWKQFKLWHENPENKRKLRSRIRTTLLMAGAASFGGAGAFFLKGLAARFAGAYAGGEGSRWIYDKTRGKDYRNKLVVMRKDFYDQVREIKETIKDPSLQEERIKELEQKYREQLKSLDTQMSSLVKKQTKERKWVDIIGRAAGAFSVRGIQELFHDPESITTSGVLDTVHAPEAKIIPTEAHIDLYSYDHADGSHTEGILDHIKETAEEYARKIAEVKEKFHTSFVYEDGMQHVDHVPKEALIHKGDGVTWILKRQLDHNPELAKVFGIEHGTAQEYAKLAKKLGYEKVLLKLNPHHAYIPGVDSHGNPVVFETNKWGKIFEVHRIDEHGNLSIHNFDKDLIDSKVTGTSHIPESQADVEPEYEYTEDWHHHTPSSNHDVIERVGDVQEVHTTVESASDTIERVGDVHEAHQAGERIVEQVQHYEPTPQEIPVYTTTTTGSPYHYDQNIHDTYPTVRDYAPRRVYRRRGFGRFFSNFLGGFYSNYRHAEQMQGIGNHLHTYGRRVAHYTGRGGGGTIRNVVRAVRGGHVNN